jgi:fatty acid desaturase
MRTLAAHRYDQDSGELSMTEQLLDSCTIATEGRLAARAANVCRALVAPVGLRYHALHHWIPSLPYHNLGRAHRVLVAKLQDDAPYRATVERGFLPPLRDLVRRSRAAARHGSTRE